LSSSKSLSLKFAVLASGNGSNFQAMVDAIESGELKSRIVKLISDNPQSHAIERARKHRIPYSIYERKKFPDKNSFEKAILADLQNSETDWILLAGYMRIVSPLLLEAFPRRILNIHPSLLPRFPGLHAIEQALQAGVQSTGCTVHFVDEGCDTGPVIAQSSFDISPTDNLESVTERMHQHEHRLYVDVLKSIEAEKIK
jgi:phosphoribosylglycinamide formyltransferase-1